MQIQAAVVRQINQLGIETVQLDPPGATEVLVRMRAAGVCHSDLHALRGELASTYPVVIGHEGAGMVEQVGANVTGVRPGDRVFVNWLPADGTCPACLRGQPNLCERLFRTTFAGKLPGGASRLRTGDNLELAHFLSAATMSEYIVIDQASAIPFPEDVPFEVAAITGCAVATGVGAVANTARLQPGNSAAVIGCGGVGLSILLGLNLAGAFPIVAIDIAESKLEMARQFGATETLNSLQGDVVKSLRRLLNGGPDYVFDSVGAPATIAQALQGVRNGGTAVIAGLHAARAQVSIPAGSLVMGGKSLLGSFAGSMRPQVDLPRLIALYRAGRLRSDRLVSRTYRLQELPQAFEDMEGGRVIRGIIVFD